MLEVHMQRTVETLFEKGYSKTQIAKMLGIDRKTSLTPASAAWRLN